MTQTEDAIQPLVSSKPKFGLDPLTVRCVKAGWRRNLVCQIVSIELATKRECPQHMNKYRKKTANNTMLANHFPPESAMLSMTLVQLPRFHSLPSPSRLFFFISFLVYFPLPHVDWALR